LAVIVFVLPPPATVAWLVMLGVGVRRHRERRAVIVS